MRHSAVCAAYRQSARSFALLTALVLRQCACGERADIASDAPVVHDSVGVAISYHRASLRFYGANGAPSNRLGRPGSGAGDFRDITFMGAGPGDSILTWDLQQRRLTLFTGERVLACTFALATNADVPFANVQGVFAEGSMLASGFILGGFPEADGMLQRMVRWTGERATLTSAVK